jgi:hypothetical protein
MKTNVGNIDRFLRGGAALLLAGLAYTGTISGGLGTAAYLVSAVLLVTAAVGTCPLYSIIGINTCPVK